MLCLRLPSVIHIYCVLPVTCHVRPVLVPTDPPARPEVPPRSRTDSGTFSPPKPSVSASGPNPLIFRHEDCRLRVPGTSSVCLATDYRGRKMGCVSVEVEVIEYIET